LKLPWLRAFLFLFCGFLTTAGCSDRPGEITVAAAVSLSESMREIGDLYQAETGTRVLFNFGASSTLALQIESGAPADAFLSADEARMDSLESRDLVVAGSRTSLLSNSLVIVVNRKNPARIESPADLTAPEIRRLALAEPSSVPAGIYARRYLVSEGLWEGIRDRVVPVENVRAALAAVETGNVDAAIVYRTDALISSGALVALEIPVEEGPSISYSAAVIGRSSNREAALRFVEYLRTPAASEVFRRHGFVVKPRG
jgi:molybdate transport system substrate-binding protein